MLYHIRKWAQNIFHGPVYNIFQLGRNARDTWVIQKILRQNSKLSKYFNFFRLSREQQQLIKEKERLQKKTI